MYICITKKSINRIASSVLGLICFILLSGTMFDDIKALQSAITPNSVTLAWTAPGDNGNTGTARRYDIRYSTSEITTENWSVAGQAIGEPNPAAAGTTQEFVVDDLIPNTLYYFAIKTLDYANNWSVVSNNDTATTQSLGSSIIVPGNYELSQNYPNPFNASTVINYYVPIPGPVKLSVHDILGRTVSTIVDEELSIGDHTATWDGIDGYGNPAATGVYFYYLSAGENNTSRKMLLLK
ncbi:MAG: T9SS type A sorting domain-containing protein [candidate division Zixibacteria bacterium]|nr:T9SS type A sorting domain-containing protein [candidate division Zixibacteria bacterium]